MNLFFYIVNTINMKKIILSLLLLIPISIKAIEKIKINNESLSPLFDNDIKVYNYFTDKDTINISVTPSKNEIISGEGQYTLSKDEEFFIISSDLYGDFKITVFKNYEENDSINEILNIDIKGYNLNFDKNLHEYNLNIENEKELDINYELSNDSAKVNITGNGNFNNTKNVIKITLDNKEEYIINVFKSQTVSKEEKTGTEVKPMSYTKKEIVKYIIITISCTLIFMFYKFIFISKFALNVLPNTLHK